MPRWSWFVIGVSIIVLLTVGFAIATSRVIRTELAEAPADAPIEPDIILGLTRRSLYANAVASQGLMLIALGVVLVLTEVELEVLAWPGAISPPWAVLLGFGFGVVLAVLNVAMQLSFDAFGIPYDDSLRVLLSPSHPGEYLLLFVVVLPTVAVFEEVLFRGVLIGALAVGYPISPWALAVGSSVLFALGHGLQGRGGLLAAGILGIVLAAGFILTESLVVVIVAHYTVNAIEFLYHRSD